MEAIWSLAIVVGPILFAIVLIYAVLRNRMEKRPGDEARSDRAAVDLRQQLDREDKAREGQP